MESIPLGCHRLNTILIYARFGNHHLEESSSHLFWPELILPCLISVLVKESLPRSKYSELPTLAKCKNPLHYGGNQRFRAVPREGRKEQHSRRLKQSPVDFIYLVDFMALLVIIRLGFFGFSLIAVSQRLLKNKFRPVTSFKFLHNLLPQCGLKVNKQT